jgi:hypothetical protein
MPPTITNNMVIMTVRELFNANAVIPFILLSFSSKDDVDYANNEFYYGMSTFHHNAIVHRFSVQRSGLKTKKASNTQSTL